MNVTHMRAKRQGILTSSSSLFSLLLFLSCGLFAQDVDLQDENFHSADSVAAKYQGYSLQNLPLLAHVLTHDMPGDALKFRAIFKWVCNNIENDYQLFTENQRNRSKFKDVDQLKAWNQTMHTRMFETLLRKRSTVCTGYAYLIRELCQFAGIKAEIVDGYGRTIAANIGGAGVINHSWSAVFLNGKWYLCDATWSSGVIDLTNKQFIRKYDDTYFLSDPEYFIRNHYPADLRWTLLNENPSLTTFLNRPIIYSAAYKYKILPQNPDQFEIETSSKKFPLFIKQGSANLPISVGVDNNPPYSVSVDRAEEKSDPHVITVTPRPGRHLVHVLVNNEVVLSYAVRGKKNLRPTPLKSSDQAQQR